MSKSNSFSLFARFILTMVLASALSLPAAAQRTTMSGGLVPSGDVADFQISPNGQYVVFRADKDTDGKDELYSVRLSTGSIVPISGAVVSGGNVAPGFQISPDSARVVFSGDLVTNDQVELFRVQIGGKALALDFDGDDQVLALSDLLMLTRYRLGVRGAALTANALGVNATISSPVTIEAKIKAALEQTVP